MRRSASATSRSPRPARSPYLRGGADWHGPAGTRPRPRASDSGSTHPRASPRPWLAHTQVDYARMLLARWAPGDREKASALLADALATYRKLGMEAWAERASALERAPKGGRTDARSRK